MWETLTEADWEFLRNYLFASLTPEQLEAVKAYDGPELFGNPNGPKRTF